MGVFALRAILCAIPRDGRRALREKDTDDPCIAPCPGGGLVPFVKWMRAEARPIEGRLRTARLANVAFDDPERPIPLVSVFHFLREASEHEGLPDLGCRVVRDSSVADLGAFGRAGLSGATPRDGLRRAIGILPYFCTHERIALVDHRDGGEILVSFAIKGHALALHIVLQYTAALIQVLVAATGSRAPIERIEVPPHPTAGIEHLRPYFGEALRAAPDKVLRVRLGASLLDAPLRCPEPDPSAAQTWCAGPTLNFGGSFAATARLLVDLILEEEVPSAEDLAGAAGLTLRTFQRRLGEEGTSFSEILDQARRDRAVSLLVGGELSVGSLATSLGYSGPACLTRAVRRWTDAPPSRLRASRGGAAG